ncbi:hypothetical protein CONCODRAFT_68393 [Conidiobolus coronatus NRRL 28638]|uniref:Uncharacterized protein n=1 Tax=Conidiobolus coronatus (strain ATCC 28846 / CBS 209.66 / NRRL 28638) TaxID=796925 RepID=A0A137PE39_CONC2|nr:hypothetical protein CONCODRAFT_68393 [Conidiobolus coronatus NRRL 28638]|eukprot:KXN73274.1 hypothetical protein CONCODRAFT_68393 [Conidiobolus coronatus NRRL 28638]
MTSAQLTLICSFVASILASNIPIMDVGNNRVQVNEAFDRFGSFGARWPGAAAGPFVRRDSGISQNNPVITLTQHVVNNPHFNGNFGRNGESINTAGGVTSGGSSLARRQNEHIRFTETETETIRENARVAAPQGVLAEEVLVEDVALPRHKFGGFLDDEDNFFANHVNTVNNFVPNGIAITGVGPDGSGLGGEAAGPITITNLSVN